MSARRASVAAYARAIERALSAVRGGPVVVSERDFALVAGWHRRGVPLAIVLDALRVAHARGKAPRSLAYLAPTIEEAWRDVGDGRASRAGNFPPARGASAEVAWQACRDALDPGSPLRAVVDRALERVARGDASDAVDASVDLELVCAAPQQLLSACEEAADRSLSAHRRRMPAAVFERTRRRAVADRLRESIGFPRRSSSA